MTPIQLFTASAMGESLVWIPLLPLLGALANGLVGRRLGRANIGLVGCATVATSAVLGLLILLPMSFPQYFRPETQTLSQSLGTWFAAGSVRVTAGLLVDHLSAVMVVVVTVVATLIHIYSIGYMAHEDDGSYARYFAYLNLFVAMMLVLVLADGLVLMFVGWEGVGLCSYLLIGFWYTDEEKAYAGRKAFVVNRIGDLGFLLGIFGLLALFGSTDFRALTGRAVGLELGVRLSSGPFAAGDFTMGGALTVCLVLLFAGACGKSAQLPLFVWLPDAMAGPTPVSALIHAATMVTAGVYLVARLNFLYAHSALAMAVVCVVGGVTAVFSALIALSQNDIKKVLAYSTVSQLGIMFIGVGVGAFWAGIFHLMTHAFFKALLFLGAGSVMHALGNETDIRRMGGLRRLLPATHSTFLWGVLAITGAAPLSGFFSKDAILHAAHGATLRDHTWAPHLAWLLGIATALLTSLYMFRLYFLVFHGERGSAGEVRESPSVMTVPLAALATGSLVTLLYGVPIMAVGAGFGAAGQPLYAAQPILENFLLQPTRLSYGLLAKPFVAESLKAPTHGLAIRAAALDTLPSWAFAWAVALVGFGVAFVLYRRGMAARAASAIATAPVILRRPARAAHALSAARFFVDEIYTVLVVGPVKALAFLLWKLADAALIDGLCVRGAARVTMWTGGLLRLFQNGNAQRYAAVISLAAAAALWVVLGGTP